MLDGDTEYNYLIKMPMNSVTEENVTKLLKEKDDKEASLLILKKTSETDMWIAELETLSIGYNKYVEKRNINESGGKIVKKKSKK